MMPPRRRTAAAVLVGFGVTAVMTAVQLWPSLGSGLLLYRDFVTAPDPVVNARSLGLDGYAPRAVPLDTVTALLSGAVPPGVQQQVMLLATLVLAGTGVTWLLRAHGPIATGVASAAATWSPYAAERLLLGQPPTLLAWSVLPWVVVAVRRPVTTWRWLAGVVLASIPAVLTPFGGVTVLAAGLTTAWVYERPRRDLGLLAAAGAGWCLPWVLPALVGSDEAGQAEGASAFQVQADGVAGFVDVFTGGGVWATGARLQSRDDPLVLVASAAMLLLALAGVRGLTPGRKRRTAVAALLAPPLVVLGLAGPAGSDVFARLQVVPGLGLVRDTHRLLLVSSMTMSVLAGLGSARLGLVTRRRVADDAQRSVSRGRPVTAYVIGVGGVATSVAVGLTGVALAVLAAPDASARLHAAYRPTTLPASWDQMVAAVGSGRALLLPWQPLRQVDWVGKQPFLDPVPLALPEPTVVARRLTVDRDGRRQVVGPPDPADAAAWSEGGPLEAATLRRAGVDRVVEWLGTPGQLPSDHPGLRLVVATPEFRVWEVP